MTDHDHVITDTNQLSAAWLTTVLMNSRALLTGSVKDIDVQHLDSTNAQLVKISLCYQAGSAGEQPLKLLLKMGSAGSNGFGPSEVHFYVRDYVGLKDARQTFGDKNR